MTHAELRNAYFSTLTLPRAEQPAALRALREAMPQANGEAWNTAFGAESLFEAFSATGLAQGVYRHNRAALAPLVARRGFRILEVGGGNGALWREGVPADAQGEIVVVDPHPDGAAGVRAAVPAGVSVTHLAESVESAALPLADAVVLSLTLHHVAGRSAAERAAHGLLGPGKREVLGRVRDAIRPRGGFLLLNEADVGCEISVPSGSVLLRERLIDSYVRRFGAAILTELTERPGAAAFHDRWRAIVRDWALGQLAAAELPLAERDVYELTVGEWLQLLGDVGLRVERYEPTDRWLLFWAYTVR